METPEFFQGAGAYHHSQFTGDAKNSDHFVDDLLDYPNDDGKAADGGFETTGVGGTSADSTVFDTSCNSSDSTGLYHFGGDAGCRNFTDGPFSCELFVPNDDLAELEWVSHFAEESFSNEDLYNMHLISGMEARNNNNGFQPEPNRATATKMFRPEMAVPAKARSKRSRAPPCNWTSRLLAVSPSPPSSATTPPMTSSLVSSSESVAFSSDKKIAKNVIKNKEIIIRNNTNIANSEGRKCLHCATDQTPQWRTGPQGPKTLCNACGVRYKSGRLVPEYRPAASPTFVLTKHSNSHRKVMELRRQKELIGSQQHHQQQFIHPNMMFDPSNVEDFLIHQQIGPNFRHLM